MSSSAAKKKDSGESEDSWVFDSLVNFLRGPVWNVPMLTFIEHKSLIFEPDTDENEKEYKKIHEEYKNLVDFMLGSYMEDIGIGSAQFEKACGQASTKIKSQFHQSLFEQVWAADDFEIFKRMMIQKNIELQLQALELLQQRYGVLPSSLQVGPDKKSGEAAAAATTSEAARQSESEAKIMEAVIKKSLEESKALDREKKSLEESVAKSGETDRARLEKQRDDQHALLAEHFKNKVSIKDPSVGQFR